MRSERGAVLVMASFIMLGGMAFSALVIDMGMVWAFRTQLQNAVDAGAHAGALALLDPVAPPDDATHAAEAVVRANRVMNASITIARLTVAPCSFSIQDAVTRGVVTLGSDCVFVEAEQPTEGFFGQVLGLTPPTVRASATAAIVQRPSTITPGTFVRSVEVVR